MFTRIHEVLKDHILIEFTNKETHSSKNDSLNDVLAALAERIPPKSFDTEVDEQCQREIAVPSKQNMYMYMYIRGGEKVNAC